MVSLIVMEPGSEWPGHVGESENVVELGEQEESLLQRIRNRLESLRLKGARVRVAVLACNEAADAASMVRRAELAHELLAGVAAVGFGRLVLNAAAHASAQLRLEEADVIAAAGNGVTDVALFTRLAHALGAATGASRVAVDEGRFSRDRQIGATGTAVSANLYLAIGISGAIQHLQGIRDCRHVIAINKDAGAPMIQRADLSAIGDAQSVMAELLTLLESASEESES